jgi:hypothetical protein
MFSARVVFAAAVFLAAAVFAAAAVVFAVTVFLTAFFVLSRLAVSSCVPSLATSAPAGPVGPTAVRRPAEKMQTRANPTIPSLAGDARRFVFLSVSSSDRLTSMGNLLVR